jgi:hypothetical protein
LQAGFPPFASVKKKAHARKVFKLNFTRRFSTLRKKMNIMFELAIFAIWNNISKRMHRSTPRELALLQRFTIAHAHFRFSRR